MFLISLLARAGLQYSALQEWKQTAFYPGTRRRPAAGTGVAHQKRQATKRRNQLRAKAAKKGGA